MNKIRRWILRFEIDQAGAWKEYLAPYFIYKTVEILQINVTILTPFKTDTEIWVVSKNMSSKKNESSK